MKYEYGYTHSSIGADGIEYITFMTDRERLDSHGLRNGPAISIDLDHKHQRTTVYKFDWIGGAPHHYECICILKDEIICDDEVPSLMTRLGVKVKGCGVMDMKETRPGVSLPGLYPSTFTPQEIEADQEKRTRRRRPGEQSPVEARAEWVHPEGRFVTVRFFFDGGSFCESFLSGKSGEERQ